MSSHSHRHSGHDHSHDVTRNADRRYLGATLILLLGYMGVEIAIGILASSLALITDAGHMLTDAAAIGLALVSMRLAERPPKGGLTFGLKRAEILSAQANGLTLLLLALWFVYEAIKRLIAPPTVEAPLMLYTALAGIVVNLLATWSLSRANRQSLNIEGSFQHIVTDLYAFIATAAAAGIIWLTGFNRADALAALVVAGLMFKAGFGLVKQSGRIFLEAAPTHLDPEKIGQTLAADPAVAAVHDLHVWEITSGFPSLSAHVLLRGGCDGHCHQKRIALERLIEERFGIHHVTLQVDHFRPEASVPVKAVGTASSPERPIESHRRRDGSR